MPTSTGTRFAAILQDARTISSRSSRLKLGASPVVPKIKMAFTPPFTT